MSKNNKVRQITEDEKPLFINPSHVGCGFLLFPNQLANLIQERHVHQTIQTNQSEFWSAVRLQNPYIPVHLMTTMDNEINPGDAIIALNELGKYPSYSIVLAPMQISADGGRTLTMIYSGFNWKTVEQEVIISAPQKISPKNK